MNAIASSLIDDADLDGIRRDMIRFAHLQLRDKAQAEDAVQEALLAALDNAKGFAGRAAFKTWVFAILKNKIVDLIRRQSRTINISALSAEEESLDQAFEA
ncbi:MAG: sigma-70 family RNA polymerase sigma factor, partial [Azonexus sp.]